MLQCLFQSSYERIAFSPLKTIKGYETALQEVLAFVGFDTDEGAFEDVFPPVGKTQAELKQAKIEYIDDFQGLGSKVLLNPTEK